MPVKSRAIIKHRIRVQVIGDHGFPVDLKGRFYRLEDLDETYVKERVNTALYKEYAGRYVKNDYDPALTNPNDKDPLDVDLCVMLKQQGLAFKIEKYVHNYP
ncbi:MAG: hypothetical protein ACFNV9_04040, partial [Corynebacterium matruchotii]